MFRWACTLAALVVASACWAAKAQVRPLGGAPALFLDGKPSTGLMLWTPRPTGGIHARDGHLALHTLAGGRSVHTRATFGTRLAAEVTVTMRTPVRQDASAGIKVPLSKGGFYYLALGHYKEGNRIKLWNHDGRSFHCWFNPVWPWKPGQPVRLRLVIDGAHIAGYAGGKLVAGKTDAQPLPPGTLSLNAHHCIATFDDLRVTRLGPKPTVLATDSFDKLDRALWNVPPSAAKRLGEFAAAGVHLVSFSLPLGWTGPDQYYYAIVDDALRVAVSANPNVRILPRVSVNAPSWWRQKHPDDICCYVGAQGRPPVRDSRQSFSSPAWRRDAGEALRRLIEHIQGSAFADNVFGYHVDAGPCEWFWNWGTLRDYSPGHERQFRVWLRARYDNDAARLRTAWANKTVSFDTAGVPSFARRKSADFFEFIDPSKGRHVLDYRAFHSEVVADSILHFARIVKKQTRGDGLFAAFYGYLLFGNECQGGYFDSGHQALTRVLESPDVDALCAPHNYQERQAGGACLPQLVTGSVRLHGKLYWDEDDTRTALTRPDAGYGRCATLGESVEVLRRNWACATSLGGTVWWMEQRAGWFSHPDVMAAIGKFQRTATTLLGRDRSTAAEIAVIVHQRSNHVLRRSSALIDPLVADQMVEQMVRVGAPFDTYIAADLDRIPDYKLYIFLNALYLTPEQRATIRRRICGKGHTVLWVYAPGFADDTGLSAELVAKLTGLQLRMEPVHARARLSLSRLDHPITRGLPPGLRFGPHRPIGPLFFCTDPKAVVLGHQTGMRGMSHYEIDGGPGLVARDFGTWRSVWCGVPGLPAPLLRGVARWAGVHIYSDQDDVVYANHVLLSLHARHAGRRTVRLPSRCTVTDAFTGKAVAKGAREFAVELSRGQTGLWLLSAK